jgi:chromosome transmission fidelity protein 18
MSISSPLLSSPFDPALHLHSEGGVECENQISACDYSDDLEALNIQAAEAIVQKTKNRIVIQHRAWRLPDVFRSDDDYYLGQCSY